MVTSIGFRLASLGPLVIRDLAGVDVTAKVDEILLGEINSSPTVNRLLKDMVSNGDLGTKTGKGSLSTVRNRWLRLSGSATGNSSSG